MEERTFPGTLDSLEPIREYVTQAAKAAGLDRGATYNLCLAIDEIATNVVVHGYEEAGLQGDLEVDSAIEPNRLVVRLTDHGKPYDPGAHDVPDEVDLSLPLEDRPIGGLGILLARKGVDELEYDVTKDGNVHRFIVHLPNRSQ